MSTITIEHILSTISSKLESDDLIEKSAWDTMDIDGSGEPEESIQPAGQPEENSGSSSIYIAENVSGSEKFSSVQHTRFGSRPSLEKPDMTSPTTRHVTTSLAADTDNLYVDARIMSALGIGMILVLTILIFVLYRK
jgi:hypothetical protein